MFLLYYPESIFLSFLEIGCIRSFFNIWNNQVISRYHTVTYTKVREGARHIAVLRIVKNLWIRLLHNLNAENRNAGLPVCLKFPTTHQWLWNTLGEVWEWVHKMAKTNPQIRSYNLLGIQIKDISHFVLMMSAWVCNEHLYPKVLLRSMEEEGI